jgi:hypothetical protein
LRQVRGKAGLNDDYPGAFLPPGFVNREVNTNSLLVPQIQTASSDSSATFTARRITEIRLSAKKPFPMAVHFPGYYDFYRH